MAQKLLLADPEQSSRRIYQEALSESEFLIEFQTRGEKVLECALDWKPDIVLLDSAIAGLACLEVCRIVKSSPATKHIPVLLLSTSKSQADLAAGFSHGADDYLAKPFHPTELLWRVRGLLRRYQGKGLEPSPQIRLGDLSLDSEQGLATLKGRRLTLTPKEFSLLEVFLRKPNRVLKRRYILETVWGFDQAVLPRVVDLTLFRLRKKLGPEARRLETVTGFGWRFNA